ncbi:hypothetical protein GCM10010327_40810 [Streptomyces nitrosporeus]|nr:hypothetical protein GCM10010327_40810 [Streptomyces nitrosporeus]
MASETVYATGAGGAGAGVEGAEGSTVMAFSGDGSVRAAAGPSRECGGPAPYFFRDRLDST